VAGWEALAAELKFGTWKIRDRVVLVRRKLSNSVVVAPDTQQALLAQLSLIEPMAKTTFMAPSSLALYLLHGVGKQTSHAAQKTLTIASTHDRADYLRAAY